MDEYNAIRKLVEIELDELSRLVWWSGSLDKERLRNYREAVEMFERYGYDIGDHQERLKRFEGCIGEVAW